MKKQLVTVLSVALFLASPIQGETTAVQQAQQAEQDNSRRSQQQMATALAGLGAAAAGVGCLMLMRQAQKETDKTTKMLLMMMAMQQCNQASQSLANAAANNNGQQQLTDSTTPTTPQAAIADNTASFPTTPSDATPLAIDIPTPAPSSAPTGQLADANQGQNLAVFDPQPSRTPSTLSEAKVVAAGDGKSALAEIPKLATNYDETAKAGGPTVDASPTQAAPTILGLGGVGSGKAETVEEAVASISSVHGKNTGEDSPASATTVSGGGASNAEKEKEEGADHDGNLNALMASLSASAPASTSPREDLVPTGALTGGGAHPTIHIFQYASILTKRLATNGAIERPTKRIASR